ncbi:glycine oxidase ThiO [Svornostia abyssi]|uniref:glycine oxidase n=1 Tax=Svornostia abyssi TaxID=2898438 RepID=A0ABY5PK26_9ACTN|nr:glycine oxidase ThiO [Parviterribacteraceae bacterium J379]
MTTTSRPDVAVIGAGVVGLGVAWRAVQRGLRVVVLERAALGQPDGAASPVAAGMLAPVSEADVGERALLDLGLRAAAAWPAFSAELGDDVGYRTCGTLLVARGADEAAALEREQALRESLGLHAERLLPSAARRLEPALAPHVRAALHVADDHAADPRRLHAALRTAALAAGVEIHTGADVTRLAREGTRATGVVLADGTTIEAGQVVVAAGAWSGTELGLPQDARVPVRPVKGQILRLRDPDGPGLLDRVLRFEGGYVVPRGDGRYVLGATMEERGFDTTVTAGGVYELLRDAIDLVPGIDELVIEETAVGFRPGVPDNTPILGRSAQVDGLVWATGHHRNGILLASITGDLVADVLTGTAAEVPA